MSSVALRNMATLRVSEARAALVPVEERFIQLSTEVRHRDSTGHPELERRSFVLLLLCLSHSRYPSWILIRGKLKTSGQRLF